MQLRFLGFVAAPFCVGLAEGLRSTNNVSEESGKSFIRYPDLPDCAVLDVGIRDPDVAKFSVPTLFDCQQICFVVKECKFYTYNLESQTCYVKDSDEVRYDRVDDISAPRECILSGASSAAPVCTAINKVYNGQALGQPVKGTYEECVLKCRQTEGCEGYSYNVADKTCTLKKELGSLVDAVDVVSATVSCDTPGAGGVPICLHGRVAIPGKDIEVSDQENVQACGMRCLEYENCKGYTFYHSTKKCHIKDTYNELDLRFERDASSGRRNCQLAGYVRCGMTNTEFADKTTKMMTADSIDNCKFFCSITDGCVAFTYDAKARKCHLKDSANQPKASEFKFSARVDCDLQTVAPCLRYDYSLTTETIKTMSGIPNATSCRRECAAVPECKAFTYNVPTKKCFLKASDAQGIDFEGDRSAPANCLLDGHPPCALVNVSSSPPRGDLDVTIQPSATSCYDKCRANQRCNFVTYTMANEWCWTKDELGTLKPNERGQLTGFKGCFVF